MGWANIDNEFNENGPSKIEKFFKNEISLWIQSESVGVCLKYVEKIMQAIVFSFHSKGKIVMASQPRNLINSMEKKDTFQISSICWI